MSITVKEIIKTLLEYDLDSKVIFVCDNKDIHFKEIFYDIDEITDNPDGTYICFSENE